MFRLTKSFNFLLVFLLILASSCKKEVEQKIEQPFSPKVFGQSESFSYVLIKNVDQTKVGESNITVEKLDSGDLKICEDISQSEVILDGKTLKAKTSHMIVKTSQGTYDVTDTFVGDSVFVSAQTPQGEQKARLKLPSNTYHNNALLMLIRGMDFKVGNSISFNNFSPYNSTTIKTVVKVIGEEKVSVPAGNFDTYHVKLDFGTITQDAWYEKDAPHRMIKYDNGKLQYRLK